MNRSSEVHADVRPPIPVDRLELGLRTVSYSARDAFLYAVAVGAGPVDLGLVYERYARSALATMATALGLWTTQAAAEALGYSRDAVLHIGQTLELRSPLPVEADLEMTGAVTKVFDKGTAAVVHIEAACDHFTATYVMYVPGLGGFGGKRGSRQILQPYDVRHRSRVPVRPDAAVLYRLTGDDHPVHVDPDVASRAGHERPIMHGLCTLGMAALQVIRDCALDPEQVTGLYATWNRPAFPGEDLEVASARSSSSPLRFTVLQRGEQVCAGWLETDAGSVGRPAKDGIGT